MYFAMDKYDVPNLSLALTEQFDATTDELNWYVLLDTGFDHKRRKVWLPGTNWPVYFQPEWGELREVSPQLIALPREDQAGWQRLLRHCQGRPMLSFVASRLDAEALCAVWQQSLSTTTSDGQSFVLRFADTRIAASLPLALSPASWQRLCAPLEHWLIIDRAGHLQPLAIPSKDVAADEKEEWLLNDRELAALLQAAQADILADRLSDDFAELLPESGALLHGWLQRTAALLSEYRIEHAPDQLMLAVAVCSSYGRVLDDARLLHALKHHATQGDSLSAVLARLLDNIYDK